MLTRGLAGGLECRREHALQKGSHDSYNFSKSFSAEGIPDLPPEREGRCSKYSI